MIMGNNNHNNVTYIYIHSNYALCHLKSVHLKACQIRKQVHPGSIHTKQNQKTFAFVLLRIKYASLPMPLSILNEASTCDRQESHPSGIAHLLTCLPAPMQLMMLTFILFPGKTLPETNIFAQKKNGWNWNTIVSFWDGLFSGANC